MLTAMTTGHEGSLSTLHAWSPGDAIRRVQTLALMGDLDLPVVGQFEVDCPVGPLVAPSV